MKRVLIVFVAVALASCTSLDRMSLELQPGMSRAEVVKVMGRPDGRSFHGTDEALQYQGVIGFGQCIYITAWLKNGILIATTQRIGSSTAGCGLGSREVDWGQMPKPIIDINVNHKI